MPEMTNFGGGRIGPWCIFSKVKHYTIQSFFKIEIGSDIQVFFFWLEETFLLIMSSFGPKSRYIPSKCSQQL